MVRSALNRLIAQLASGGRAPASSQQPRITTTWRVSEEALEAAPPPLPASLREIVNPNRVFESPDLVLTGQGVWRFTARIATACGRLRICVDHAAQSEAEILGWRARSRLTLRNYAELAAGEELAFDVVEQDSARPKVWCWSSDPKSEEALCTDVDMTRCRFAFIADEREEQSFYFVVKVVPGEHPTPILIGENLFGYKDAWEAESPLAAPPRWRGR